MECQNPEIQVHLTSLEFPQFQGNLRIEKGLGECQQLKGIMHFHFILRIGVEGQRKNMEKNNVSKDRRVYKQKEKEKWSNQTYIVHSKQWEILSASVQCAISKVWWHSVGKGNELCLLHSLIMLFLTIYLEIKQHILVLV